MTSNQTMDYYVQPQHIYSHSRTCTHRGLYRRPLRLVEFHICYILDHASIHEMSALMIIFQCILDIFIHYGDLDPLYIVRGDDHTWNLYIMPIHGHCTLMYSVLLFVYLKSYAQIDHCIVLMSGWFFHLGLHYSTSGMDIMYFSHHVTPMTSHIRRHMLQMILPHQVYLTFMAFLVPLQNLWTPWTIIVPLIFQDHP